MWETLLLKYPGFYERPLGPSQLSYGSQRKDHSTQDNR